MSNKQIAKHISANRDDGDGLPTVENWSDKNSKVTVEQREGFTCKVSVTTKVDLPPEKMFDILTHPENNRIFRGVKKVLSRRIVHRAPGRQTVEVEQEGQWRFLMFRGSFITKLHVVEDRRNGVIDFRLSQPGMMRRFEGRWTLKPFTQETLDSVYDMQHKHKWLGLRQAMSSVQQSLGMKRPTATLATLEQSVLPAVSPPKALEGLMKSITTKIVAGVVQDMQTASKNINAGKLIWPPPDEED